MRNAKFQRPNTKNANAKHSLDENSGRVVIGA
jgi:hypothetical protein